MSIKDKYTVKSIDKWECKDWLLNKHYAHKIPLIIYAFGLFNEQNLLCGCCTFSPPARMLNMGYGIFGDTIKVHTIELSRLVVNEGMEKNVLSFFVSKSINFLPTPICIISYADSNSGHHGYIYQATNWHYCGITSIEKTYFDTINNKILHPRTVVQNYGSREVDKLPKHIEINKENGGKYRYVKFLGNKNQIKEMILKNTYPILPYPKGDNTRYDASYKPTIQTNLF